MRSCFKTLSTAASESFCPASSLIIRCVSMDMRLKLKTNLNKNPSLAAVLRVLKQLLRFLITLQVVFYCFYLPIGQCNPDSLNALAFREKMIGHIVGKSPMDSCLFYKNASSGLFRKNEDWANWAKVYALAGYYLSIKGNHEKSIDIYEEGMQGMEKWRKPQNKTEWEIYGKYLVSTAYVYSKWFGNYRKAKNNYEEAKDIFENKLGIFDSEYIVFYLYHRLGNIYTRYGDFDKAEKLLKKSVEKCISDKNWNRAAEAYTDLANVYHSEGDIHRAISTLEEGLDLGQLQPYSKSFLEVSLVNYYLMIDKVDAAKRLLEKTAETVETIENEKHREGQKCEIESLWAEIYTAENSWEKAETFYKSSLQKYINYFGTPFRREIGKDYLRLGQFYLERKEYDKALEQFHAGQISLFIDFENTPPETLPADSVIYPENTIADIMSGKALAFEAMSRAATSKNEKEKYLLLSIRCYELIFKVWQKLRQTYDFESSHFLVLDLNRPLLEKAINVALEAWEMTNEDEFYNKAFSFSEMGKNILLLELIQSNKKNIAVAIPDSLLSQEHELNFKIAAIEEELYLKKSIGEKDETLEEVLFKTKEKLGKLIRYMEREFPEYYQLKYDYPIPPISNVQQTLKKEKAHLLEYFIGDSAIYVFHITPIDKYVETIKFDFPLIDWINGYRRGLYEYNSLPDNSKNDTLKEELDLMYVKNAFDLYQKLIAPVEGLANRIVIVPDGVLGYIPFEALLTKKAVKPYAFTSHEYFGKSHMISYNYSTALWMEMREKKHRSSGLLAMAPAFKDDLLTGQRMSSTMALPITRKGLGRLDYNDKEVEKICLAFGGTPLIGDHALIDSFILLAKNYSILHLSTHAKMNEADSDFSYLAFTGADVEKGTNILYINDLYNMQLPLDMVVLSACETGIGELRKGEGIISLARGFTSAGAKSIMTTLWAVNDMATRDIMVGFYSNLNDGYDKDEALQMAKINFWENQMSEDNAHPYFWSSFIAIGDMAPLKDKWFENIWLWIGAMVIFIFLLFFLKKRNKK